MDRESVLRKIEAGSDVSVAELGAVLLAAISRQNEDLNDFARLTMSEFEKADTRFRKANSELERVNVRLDRFEWLESRVSKLA